MSDPIKDTLDSIKERISAPFFGYVVASLIAFNWSELFYLAYSKESAEFKIDYIISTYDSWKQFWKPVLVGFVVCAISPYISTLIKIIKYLTVYIDERIDANKNNLAKIFQARKERDLEEIISKKKIYSTEIANHNREYEKTRDNIIAARSEYDTATRIKRELLQENESLIEDNRKLEWEIRTKQATIGTNDMLKAASDIYIDEINDLIMQMSFLAGSFEEKIKKIEYITNDTNHNNELDSEIDRKSELRETIEAMKSLVASLNDSPIVIKSTAKAKFERFASSESNNERPQTN
ncbi:TPA: coiled-coil domain-containing protein [Serratia marcescens]